MALTPLMGAAAGFVIGLVVFRGRELYFSLLTLGVGQLVWAVAHGWQSLTGGTNGTNGVFAADWINAFLHPDQLYWFIFGVVLLCTGDGVRDHEVPVWRRIAWYPREPPSRRVRRPLGEAL